MKKENQLRVEISCLHSGVTGSCHIVDLFVPEGEGYKKKSFLVDFGIFQGIDDKNHINEKIFPKNIHELLFVALSHSHADHYGRLPLLMNADKGHNFNGRVITSKLTNTLLNIGLNDSLSVITKNAKMYKNESQLYHESDVRKTFRKIEGLDFFKWIFLNENIYVYLIPNAHLLGACMFLFKFVHEDFEDKFVLFTGDFNVDNKMIQISQSGENFYNRPMDIVIESTYGNIDKKDIEIKFEKDISCALKQHKTIIIPTYSLGKTQEICYVLKSMQKNGKIPKDVIICLDGITAQCYTLLTSKLEEHVLKPFKYQTDFLPKRLFYVIKNLDNTPYVSSNKHKNKFGKKSRYSSRKKNNTVFSEYLKKIPDEQLIDRDEVLNNYTNKIIISSSGSGSHGPSEEYIKRFIGHEAVLVYFPGFVFHGSLGEKLLQAEPNESIEWANTVLVKKAEVLQTFEFSSHAKADELIGFLNKFTNLNKVIINHGDPEVKDIFKARVEKDVTKNVVLLEPTTKITL